MTGYFKSIPIGMAVIALSCLISGATIAQQHVFPKNGQSPEQQQKDEYECHQWASQQSGVDPTKPQAPPPTTAAPAPQKSQPRHGRNTLAGAAKGYTFGKVVGGNSNKSAKTGAAVGVMRGARRNRGQQQQQAQQHQQAQSDLHKSYSRARGTCRDAKGYSVG